MFFELPVPISLAIGSAFSQYLLLNIRRQALKRERAETDFSLEGIQFRSRPEFAEDVPDISFGSIHPIVATTN